jgi:hypothetical protein
MARTSLTGYQREYGSNGKSATPAVRLNSIQLDVDIAQVSTTGTGKTLPKGCLPLFAQNIGGNGSAASTIDIGLSGGNADALANELPGDAYSALVITGTSLGTELTVDTEITAGAGAVAGTGTVKLAVYYVMADDGTA